MDWLEDFWSKVVGWWDHTSANMYNGIVAFVNSLVEIWNGCRLSLRCAGSLTGWAT
jgi:hypothetical protein